MLLKLGLEYQDKRVYGFVCFYFRVYLLHPSQPEGVHLSRERLGMQRKRWHIKAIMKKRKMDES